MPSLDVVAVRTVLVAMLRSFTFAPAITLPWGSLTVPRTVESPCCARAVRVHSAISRKMLANRLVLLQKILVFIESSDTSFADLRDLEPPRRTTREVVDSTSWLQSGSLLKFTDRLLLCYTESKR